MTTMNIHSTNGWQNWSTISGQISLTSGIQTIRIYSLNGSWNFNWFEFSLAGSTASNIPPTVSAGLNQTITLPVNAVTLKGSATDADGTIASVNWKQLSGPNTSIISTPGQLQTIVSGLLQGAYIFQLTATDNKGASSSSNVQVTVNGGTVVSSTSACGRAIKVVVLGSSTAYGTGATPIDSSWVNKYTYYLKSKNSQNTVINLAEPGYTTYEVLRPTGSVPPANRPAPDTAHNITKALSLHPDAIIINLPNNDIGYGFTLDEIESNYETTVSLAKTAGIPLWITTTQPRTNLNTGERNNLMVLRDWTYSRFGGHAIDFWTTVANPDGSINSLYSYGDNIHVNNAGHQIFFSRAADKKIPDSLCAGSTTTSPATTGLTKYIKTQIYGGSSAYSDPQWNNWNVGTASINSINSGGLKYTDGTFSSINATLSYSQSVGDNGINYATTISGAMAPAGVLRFTSYADANRTLTINGLSPSKKYDVEFYASRFSSGNNTIFTINGNAITINTYDNYFNKAKFTSLIPNTQGQIIVTINKSNMYSYINGFMITEQGTDYTPASNSTNRSAATIPDGQSGIEVYPNPFNSQLSILVHKPFAGAYTLQVIDVNGRIKKSYHLTKYPGQDALLTIPVTDIEKGTYFIKVIMGNWTDVKKVIRN
ncbi:MAG: PKD domain-containing protein [Flavisolibacter sp.]